MSTAQSHLHHTLYLRNQLEPTHRRPKSIDVISGSRNLNRLDRLKSRGNVKRMLMTFLKGTNKLEQSNSITYDKRFFSAYKDERDHLGRIIA
jgi:hypothetical protein